MPRIAIVEPDRCKPKDCGLVCIKYCPGVRMGEETITLDPETGKARIAENLCTGTGICVKKCPFGAIHVVNLPAELEKDVSYRYGANRFVLYRLPIPRPEKVTGLIGQNGTGKSTALKILSGDFKPNFGLYDEPPEWDEIITAYRGSELQSYFEKLSTESIRVVQKPQYVDKIPNVTKGVVSELLEKVNERNMLKSIIEDLRIDKIMDRELSVISGGELQRVAIAAVILKDADVYLFDEPSSYLDIYQRVEVAKVIQRLAKEGKTVIVVEHDLAILDYLSEYVCVLYGEPAVFGVVSHPHGVREGINIFLDGYLPSENMRFRKDAIQFHLRPPRSKPVGKALFDFEEMEKRYDGFKLTTEGGKVFIGEVIGILGANALGKSTFIKLLAGIEEPDKGEVPSEDLKVSHKPQYISPKFDGSVKELFREEIGKVINTEWFKSEVNRPLTIDPLLDCSIDSLSGGELQRVAIALCLARPADIYLLDEPSAFLDVEQRLAAARAIKKIAESRDVVAFVVEHDIVTIDFISDRLMIFSGQPAVEGYAMKPVDLRSGMNKFLKLMGITFRRDPQTGRPRVNKEGSKLDRLQKEEGEYYYVSGMKNS
ncbi:ribosome biogenesis/translation initiation ATPase RLI [Candidatus Borrarchaeum sp.]|uniref:ribosome biogenesis/translation initiation ATPase RLI n=1 Tax=Candidatus Borrarchaeum sp. TaxID=2846742 RepID=UPI002579B956|nr:ribosome biogenesis/translation initiation ATPase RLI [Candidatus Borrarchaeum sp.]